MFTFFAAKADLVLGYHHCFRAKAAEALSGVHADLLARKLGTGCRAALAALDRFRVGSQTNDDAADKDDGCDDVEDC